MPSSNSVPRVGRSCPSTRRRNVLLPQPDGPTIETKAPDVIAILMRSSTIWSPYSTHTSRAVIALIDTPLLVRPGERRTRQPCERVIHQIGEQCDPGDVRQDHVHGEKPPHQED